MIARNQSISGIISKPWVDTFPGGPATSCQGKSLSHCYILHYIYDIPSLYVTYRETLRMFVEEGIGLSICETSDGGDEDVNMGKLDQSLQVCMGRQIN